MRDGTASAVATVSGDRVAQGFSDAGHRRRVDADAGVLPDGRLRTYYIPARTRRARVRSASPPRSPPMPSAGRLRAPPFVPRHRDPPTWFGFPDGHFRMYFTASEDPDLPRKSSGRSRARSQMTRSTDGRRGQRLTAPHFRSLSPDTESSPRLRPPA